MANNTKKKSTRSQSKKPTPKPLSKETSPSQEELARQLLPPYVPIDFSVSPVHLELVNKKIRALKKKLRKIYDIEQTLKDGSKKITKEQQDSLINKQALERNLADFEEIRESVEQIDLSAQLRLLLGVFFTAASTSSDVLTSLSTLLLPPSCPPATYNPLQELQHACNIAQQFLSNSQELIFDNPPTTCSQFCFCYACDYLSLSDLVILVNQLQDEVKAFLVPKEGYVEPELPVKAVVVEKPAPVESEEPVAEELKPVKKQKVSEESIAKPQDLSEVPKEDTETKVGEESENKDQKKQMKKRGGNRGKSRGNKSQGDRGAPKRGRGKPDRGNHGDKAEKSADAPEREDKRTRGNYRGRGGGRGRGGNSSNRGKGKDTPKQTPPPPKS